MTKTRTTIQLETERLTKFKAECKNKGLLWRPVLDAAIDRETKELKQSKVKGMTRKAQGTL